MAEASFHPFPDLPPEVQDLVWDAAVRPADRSHVHSFIVTDRHHKYADTASVPGFFLRFRPGWRWNAGYKLAVPHDDPSVGPNSSVYLSDSGLWMACKQSRAAMERRFPMNEWWSDMPGQAQPQRRAKAGEYFGQENVSHTASYRDSDSKVRHVTICPQRDLIYFAPIKTDSINWFHHYAFGDVLLLDSREYSDLSAIPSFLGLGLNVALDYHPLMLGSLASRMIHCRHRLLSFSSSSLIDMVDVFHGATGRTMWFIDHRLKRSATRAGPRTSTQMSDNEPATDDARDDRRVFHSNDCVFTEVRREDQSEWVIEEKDSNGTVFDFFDLLHTVSIGSLELEGSERMKVLACEATPGAAPRPPTTWDAGNTACTTCVEEEREALASRRRVLRAVESDDDDLFNVDDFVLNLFE